MRRTDFFAILAGAGAAVLFLPLLLSGSIGSLSQNLQNIVDLLVVALLISCGTLMMEPRIQDWRHSGVIVDDLKNPEVRLRLEAKLKERVTQLIAGEVAQHVLNDFPTLKPLIDGLTLMDEKQAHSKKLEAHDMINLQMVYYNALLGSLGSSPFSAEQLVNNAIDIMTLRKDAVMVRKVEWAGGET